MAHVLYIKANSRDNSATYTVSDAFVESYKEANPEDTVEVLDLYEAGVDFIRGDVMSGEGDTSVYMQHAQKFASVDKYLIAAPMWNFSFPAIFKAYIDYVVMHGVTFEFTSTGAVGLLADKGKKALLISASGGNYATPEMAPLDFRLPYLKTVFGFMGITEVDAVYVYGTMQSASKDSAVETALTDAKEKASNW